MHISESVAAAWATFDFRIAFAIVAAYICIDALNAFYTLNVVRLKEFAAANTTIFIYLLLAFGVINYTHNFLYIIPVAIGGWVGTFFLVRWQRRHKKHRVAVRRKRVK